MVSENRQAASDFVSYLSVKNNADLNEKLINPLVDKFFKERDVINYQSVMENADIADLDYFKKERFFEYLYSYVFDDICKKNGKVEIVVKYCVTLDKINCPKKCENTGLFYDMILLYDQPVFYFIYVDIKIIFEFLRFVHEK